MTEFTDISTERLGLDDSFSFSCDSGLACFNKCCRDINLYLTPYDILRMKRRLRVPSDEFLRTYTFPLFPEEIGHPVILLKMMPDETKNCPFVSEQGCMVYDDRPWSCRSFPLEPLADNEGPPAFGIVKRDFCLGFGRGRMSRTVRRWRDSQNVALYEDMNGEWKKITHHRDFTSKNFLDGYYRDIFFLGSYNIDEFRNLVSRGELQKYFDIGNSVLKRIKSNETELMRFAFRWMRCVIFGEATLKRR